MKLKPSVHHPTPKSVQEICRWHFCGHQVNTLRIPQSYQLQRWRHTIYWEHQCRQFYAFILDTMVIQQSNDSLTTTVFRKPTHIDQYLQWVSHRAISAKYNVISTLFHRAKPACSTTQQLQEEHEHLQKVLTRCKYPRWTLNKIKNKISAPNPPKGKSNNNMKPTSSSTITSSINRRNYLVVPCTKGLTESLKNVYRKHGIQVYFKGGKTIEDLLMALRVKDHITKRSGIICRFKCDRVECGKE